MLLELNLGPWSLPAAAGGAFWTQQHTPATAKGLSIASCKKCDNRKYKPLLAWQVQLVRL